MTESITLQAAHIHYEDVGDGVAAADGPAFVFLHYWGGSSRTWRHVIRPLAPAARCIAVDLRGWGASRPLDGRYDMEAMAGDVLALVQHLGLKRYVLVGHSMGGKVAQLVARGNPAGLAGVVLVAPSPPGGMPVPVEVRAGMLASYQSAEGVAQALGILAHRPLADADRQQVIADTLGGADLAKSYWTEAGMTADIGDIAGIAAPVRIVVGDHDQVERADVLKPLYAGLLPAAQFQVLEGVGHLSPLEAPEAVVRCCADLLHAAWRSGHTNSI